MKKILLGLIVLVCYGALNISCNKEEDLGIINLKLGQDYEDSDLTLKFNSVKSDSRCPLDLNCVWAGNAEVLLNFNKKININVDFVLNTHSGVNYKNDTLINGYRIKLINVLPYPESTKEIDPNDYSIEVEITRE